MTRQVIQHPHPLYDSARARGIRARCACLECRGWRAITLQLRAAREKLIRRMELIRAGLSLRTGIGVQAHLTDSGLAMFDTSGRCFVVNLPERSSNMRIIEDLVVQLQTTPDEPEWGA